MPSRLLAAQQFTAAWQNIVSIFKANHATNVVWTLDYSSAETATCLIPLLWPGNDEVDWVVYDSYSQGTDSWDDSVGAFYAQLQNASSPTTDFDSKPWGVGEFGDCNAGSADAQTYFESAKTALDANTYPKLKMFLVFASTGNSSPFGCLTDYVTNPTPPPPGTYAPQKQAAFNDFFDDPNA